MGKYSRPGWKCNCAGLKQHQTQRPKNLDKNIKLQDTLFLLKLREYLEQLSGLSENTIGKCEQSSLRR